MTENKKRKADGNTSADLSVANNIITETSKLVKGPKNKIITALESISDERKLKLLCDFILSRHQKGNPVSEIALTRMLNKLDKHPIDAQLKALDISIERGWTGVFPKEDKKTSVSGFDSSSFSLEKARTKINNFD